MKTTFTLQPRKIGIFLGILAVVMSALAVLGDTLELKFDSGDARDGGTVLIWPFARQFNSVEEGNIANFYQSLQLVLASVLLLIVWREKVQRKEPMRRPWLALGLIFLYLGVDEAAQIHETTIANTVAAFRSNESDKTGWFWVYLPLLAVFGLAFIPFLMRLPRRIAALFMGSGTIYAGGVIVMEKFVNWVAGKYGDDTMTYVLVDNLSELMESTGIALFVYAVVSYIALGGEEVSFRLRSTEKDSK